MGGRGSRVKGFGFEREGVQDFKAAGLSARRFWGSDGRSAGFPGFSAIPTLKSCARQSVFREKFRPRKPSRSS